MRPILVFVDERRLKAPALQCRAAGALLSPALISEMVVLRREELYDLVL
jgi:hypothetical protein